jgi:hypothetical protein
MLYLYELKTERYYENWPSLLSAIIPVFLRRRRLSSIVPTTAGGTVHNKIETRQGLHKELYLTFVPHTTLLYTHIKRKIKFQSTQTNKKGIKNHGYIEKLRRKGNEYT